MIANALLLPSETPPATRDVKRLLLSFDRIQIPNPADRDIIPPDMFMAAWSQFPIIFSGTDPVRPLGKTKGFDDNFDKTLSECRSACAANVIKVMPNLTEALKGSTFMGRPLPEGAPDFVRAYRDYRLLASNTDLVSSVASGLQDPAHLDDASLSNLSLSGGDDMEITTMPRSAEYGGKLVSEHFRKSMTRMCLARVAAVVKWFHYCDKNAIVPASANRGQSSLLEQLRRNVSALSGPQTIAGEGEGHRALFLAISEMHGLAMQTMVADETIDAMSIEDVMKCRTRAWGIANEGREHFLRTIKDISMIETNPESFRRAAQIQISKYKEKRGELDSEWSKLGIKFTCETVAGITSGIGSSELRERYLGCGLLQTFLLLGGWIAFRAKDYLPQLNDLLKQEAALKTSNGYGLITPYRGFGPAK